MIYLSVTKWFVVELKKLLKPEEAIHKMTRLPLLYMELKDRGLIVKNNSADIVIFNPATVRDKSTFEKPHQYPESILYVNRVITVDSGIFTTNRAGKVLYGPAKK